MSESVEIARAARRTGLIFLGIIIAALTMVLAWLIPEARRIARDRDTRVNDGRAGSNMVRVPGGAFTMGANDGAADEQPLHDVRVSPFWMDRTEITNEEFTRFTKVTGHITTAELPPRGVADGNLPADQAQPGSWCFRTSADSKPEDRRTWIAFVPGANWRRPAGPGSEITGREKFPAVHVSYDDAVAYCKWARRRLPTEAEWECAARGGAGLMRFPSGKEIVSGSRWMANCRQGNIVAKDEAADGFSSLAPVGSFPANGFGLNDLAGNVAEWCADWYDPAYYAQLRPDPNFSAHRNPRGPEVSIDPKEPGVSKRVVRGGSFVSDVIDCRVSARGRETPIFTAEWLGFRSVKDAQ